jgi:hypothetical protein
MRSSPRNGRAKVAPRKGEKLMLAKRGESLAKARNWKPSSPTDKNQTNSGQFKPKLFENSCQRLEF